MCSMECLGNGLGRSLVSLLSQVIWLEVDGAAPRETMRRPKTRIHSSDSAHEEGSPWTPYTSILQLVTTRHF